MYEIKKLQNGNEEINDVSKDKSKIIYSLWLCGSSSTLIKNLSRSIQTMTD